VFLNGGFHQNDIHGGVIRTGRQFIPSWCRGTGQLTDWVEDAGAIRRFSLFHPPHFDANPISGIESGANDSRFRKVEIC
jgi:hypothetical protein